MVRLTDIAVRKLKAKPHRQEIPDAGCAGLYLVIQPTGRRRYATRFRIGGVSKKLTHPAGISLSMARQLNTVALNAAAQGQDPTVAKRVEQDKAKHTLRGVIAEYLASPEARRLRTAYERRRQLETLVYPSKLAARPVTSIKRSDIAELLDYVANNHGLRTADHVLSLLKRILSLYAMRNDDFSPPFVAGMRRYRYSEHQRTRTLSDDELRKVWVAADKAGPFGVLIKFLLLTSARLREASNMSWSELDERGDWELPAARNKARVPVLRPLSSILRPTACDRCWGSRVERPRSIVSAACAILPCTIFAVPRAR